MINRPAIVPHNCIKVAWFVTSRNNHSEGIDEAMKAAIMVTRPANTESAKAAIGFGSFAKAYPVNQIGPANLSTNCNMLI